MNAFFQFIIWMYNYLCAKVICLELQLGQKDVLFGLLVLA
jgi:hypothetical protein